MDAKVDYRRLVEAKLNVLGVAGRERRQRRRERRSDDGALPRRLRRWRRCCAGAGRRRGCGRRSARQAQAEPLEPIAAPITGAARSGTSASAPSQFPLDRGGQRRRASRSARATAASLALEADERPRAAGARNVGAPVSAGVGSDGALRRGRHARRRPGRARSRPGHVAQGARRRASRPRRWSPASACSCSASIARCRPSTPLDGAKLWQVQRPGDPLTLAQAGVHRRVQGHAARRPGSAHGRHRSARGDAALGGPARLAARRQRGRAPRRPGRPGVARRRPASARARSRRRSAASMPSAARIAVDQNDRRHRRGRRRRASCCSAPTPPTASPPGASAERRRRLDLGGAAVPRPRRAGGGRRVGRVRRLRGHAALAVSATRASRSCALPTDGSAIAAPPVRRRRHARSSSRASGGVFALPPAPERGPTRASDAPP